jgi:hypothetical protein
MYLCKKSELLSSLNEFLFQVVFYEEEYREHAKAAYRTSRC